MSVAPTDLSRTLVRRASSKRGADEEERDRCRRALALALPAMLRELGFTRAWLIGSLAWGGFGVRSDIDVVVEGAGTDALNAIADAIGSATGRTIDVLAFETLPPSFRERVLSDGIHVA